MRTNGSLSRKLLLGIAIAFAVSCGPGAADIMRDAMVDAMSGPDAADIVRDAMVDAMSVPDAAAQDGCATNCTSGGSLRTATADTDRDQLLRGGTQVNTTGNLSVEVVRGPFVLTDARMNSFAAPGGASVTAATFWVVPSAEGCGDYTAFAAESRLGAIRGPSSVDAPTLEIHGARYLIDSDEVLCAEGNAIVAWAGFRPYQ